MDKSDFKQELVELKSTTIENDGNSEQEMTRTVDYSFEISDTWSKSGSLEAGVGTEIKSGIPLLPEVSYNYV